MWASARKIAVLSLLYFVQGLPYGFQATALPVYLRAQGLSLRGVALLGLLSLPWSLKALWAPLVDRFGSDRVGRRKSWILPLQALLALVCVQAALVDPSKAIDPLLWAVLAMNLFAATMDIAVDAMAVDMLDETELGVGNAAQVVGYKAGMLTGGGLLMALAGHIGLRGQLLAMGGLVVVSLLLTALITEPKPRAREQAEREKGQGEQATMKAVLATALKVVTRPTALLVLLLVATYKTGETLIDTMYKPFLVDAGFGPEKIGLWLGTYGMVASIVGSLAGGVLASKTTMTRALVIASLLRVVPLVGEWWLTTVTPSDGAVIVVSVAEHVFGGMLTTAMFAFMMSRVDQRIGATHYTLLASVEVWGKAPAGLVSGDLATRFGYGPVFGAGVALSVLFLAILPPLRRLERVTPSDKALS